MRFLPSIAAFLIGGGLQISGLVIPWLGYAFMILGVVLLVIPIVFLIRKGSLKTKLGNLLLNGETIVLGQLDEVDENRATGLVNEWVAITIDLLNKEKEEESSYFLSNIGLEEPLTLKGVMRNRLSRLKDIFERL